jgi:hypothetical protein
MRFVQALSAITFAASLVPASGTPATAQGRGPGGGDVCFYEHINFQGRAWCIDADQRVPALDPSANDRISSVQVPPGVRVTVCEHVNYAGRCLTLDRPAANLLNVGFNDMISSVASEIVRAGPPGRPGLGGPSPGPGRQDFRGPPPPRGPQFGGPPPVAPAPENGGATWEEVREQMAELRAECEDGDRRSCVRLGIIIGENRERRAQWRREHPDFFWWER